jgi:hypothetical protein
MAYWIFQANPQKYRILEALAEQDELTWLVNQHAGEIRQGDSVLIWKAGDASGVYAVGEILSDPAVMEDNDPLWADDASAEGTAPRPRVRIHLTHRLIDGPILRSALLEDPLLNNLSILRFAHGTNFPVAEEEWNRILAVANLTPRDNIRQDPEHRLDVAEIHLRQAIARNLAQIEPELTPYFDDRFEEYPVPGGRIDLLCKDAAGRPVIIELKRHHWNTDKAIGQIARYMGWARERLSNGEHVRGILLILDDGTQDQRLDSAKAAVPGLEVRHYSITFRIA